MHCLLRIRRYRLGIGVNLGSLPVLEQIIPYCHITDKSRFEPSPGVILQENRRHPMLPEDILLDDHLSPGRAQYPPGGHIFRQVVPDGHIRRPCDIFHRVAACPDPLRQCFFQHQLDIRIILSAKILYYVSVIGHQALPVYQLDLIPRLKGLESPGLLMHETYRQSPLRPVRLHNPQMCSVDVDGIVMGTAEVAVRDEDLAPAARHLHKIREAGAGPPRLRARGAFQPVQRQVFRVLPYDPQPMHIMESAVLKCHVLASMDEDTHLIPDSVPRLVGTSLPVAASLRKFQLQHIVPQVCDAASVAIPWDAPKRAPVRIQLLQQAGGILPVARLPVGQRPLALPQNRIRSSVTVRILQSVQRILMYLYPYICIRFHGNGIFGYGRPGIIQIEVPEYDILAAVYQDGRHHPVHQEQGAGAVYDHIFHILHKDGAPSLTIRILQFAGRIGDVISPGMVCALRPHLIYLPRLEPDFHESLFLPRLLDCRPDFQGRIHSLARVRHCDNLCRMLSCSLLTHHAECSFLCRQPCIIQKRFRGYQSVCLHSTMTSFLCS